MRNNKKTAILVKEVNNKKRLFLVYRPNTGRQLKLESYADIKKKFKKVTEHYFINSAMRRDSILELVNLIYLFSAVLGFVRRRQAALD